MADLKTRIAFGPEANVDNAIAQGLVDANDIMFLNEGKIAWIKSDGTKVMLEDKQQVCKVDALPEVGEENIVYIFEGSLYVWDGTTYVNPVGGGGVSEDIVDTKITASAEELRAYTDEQIENAVAVEVIEF